MGSGWHEWPLIIFTVLGQCVVGGFIVLALALIKGDLTREQQQRVVRSMFGLWVLMGVGFIASTLHLGSPMRAFNSLNRVGASSLSNEIASGALFFAVGGIGWLLAMFIGGPLLGYLLLRFADVNGWAMRLLPAVTLLALVVSVTVVLMQGQELTTIHSSIQQASALVPNYGSLMAWRVVALVLALVCWIAPQLKGYQPALPLLGLAFALVLVGEAIGRGVFYGLHMTVGMAIAS